jgi:hypothetical protein
MVDQRCISRRALLISGAGAFAAAAVAADAPITPRRKIALFNGRNLDGLYTWLKPTKYEDPKRVFSVRDGLLRISGEEFGGIGTRRSYRDYHLSLEWKWGGATCDPRRDKARDSGILLHASGEDGAYGGIWPESFECQIIEGGCGDFLVVAGKGKPTLTAECRLGPDNQHYWKEGGTPVTKDGGRFNWWGRDPEWKDVLGFRGRQDVEKPMGGWNLSEVICDADSMTNLVNGVVVNRAGKASLTDGKIMVQSEGAEVLVRRWEIAPLARKK